MTKQQLCTLWDRINIKYEKAIDNRDRRTVNRLHKQLREISHKIEQL